MAESIARSDFRRHLTSRGEGRPHIRAGWVSTRVVQVDAMPLRVCLHHGSIESAWLTVATDRASGLVLTACVTLGRRNWHDATLASRAGVGRARSRRSDRTGTCANRGSDDMAQFGDAERPWSIKPTPARARRWPAFRSAPAAPER
jgi:hypothetical protein